MKATTITTLLAAAILAGCQWSAQSEASAHSAFRLACSHQTMRYSQTERDGLLIFEATCKPDR